MIIDKEVDFEILRPLSAKLLEETKAEKQGLIDRSKLFDIQGRREKGRLSLQKNTRLLIPSLEGAFIMRKRILQKAKSSS